MDEVMVDFGVFGIVRRPDDDGRSARRGSCPAKENRIGNAHILDVIQLLRRKLHSHPMAIAGPAKIPVHIEPPENSVRRVNASTWTVSVYVDAHRRRASSIDGEILDHESVHLLHIDHRAVPRSGPRT